jgi:hypothetical protein
MKPIRITPENAEAIEAALAAVNGKAERHAYTLTSELDRLARAAEAELMSLVGAEKYAPGATWVETSGATVANSYGYRRDATRVTLTRRPTGWFLTEATSVQIHAQGGGRGRLTLTQAQDERAVAVLRARYAVAAPAVAA